LRAKLGGLLLRPAVMALREEIDPETTGGAYMLGCARSGSWPRALHARGFARAIEVAGGASRRT